MRLDQCPWGEIQILEHVSQGILAITTSSHGGFWVPPSLRKKIPLKLRRDAAKWANGYGAGWFEQDCCARYVVAYIPEAFSKGRSERALKLIFDTLSQLRNTVKDRK